MKWSIFGKKRLEFCAGKSSTSSPATPTSSIVASPLRSLYGPSGGGTAGTDYVGTKLYQSSQPVEQQDIDCSAEFLYEGFVAAPRPQHLSPLDQETQTPRSLSPVSVNDEQEAEPVSPLTPCSVRSCPETEQVLGFCPNCHSIVLPLTKKRPHIRTNPWLWSKRARLNASSSGRVSGHGKSRRKGELEQNGTSITDSGIFDPSPTNSAQESADLVSSQAVTPGTDTPMPRASSESRSTPHRVLSDSSDSEDTLIERREERRKYRRRRRRRKKQPAVVRPRPERPELVEVDENEQRREWHTADEQATHEEGQQLRLFPRRRSRQATEQELRLEDRGVQSDRAFRPIMTQQQQQPVVDDSERPKSPIKRKAESRDSPSPVFCLPQSDNSDLWEIRGTEAAPSFPIMNTYPLIAPTFGPSFSYPQQSPPSPAGPSVPMAALADEDAMADAEVCEYSRRHVSQIRSGLRERIEQLKRDRILLEEKLQVTRDSSLRSNREQECWAREVRDYRKQLMLRMLASAKGQVNRHLDRLQDSYDALLLEKLNTALESADQGDVETFEDEL